MKKLLFLSCYGINFPPEPVRESPGSGGTIETYYKNYYSGGFISSNLMSKTSVENGWIGDPWGD